MLTILLPSRHLKCYKLSKAYEIVCMVGESVLSGGKCLTAATSVLQIQVFPALYSLRGMLIMSGKCVIHLHNSVDCYVQFPVELPAMHRTAAYHVWRLIGRLLVSSRKGFRLSQEVTKLEVE